MSEPSASRRPRWPAVARLVVALSLLAWVGASVPWHDTLETGERAWRGEILGDWKAEPIRFRFTPGQDPEESPLAGSAAATAARFGGQVLVHPERLRTVRWRAGASGEAEPVEGATPEHLEGDYRWQPGMLTAFSDLELSGVAFAFGCLVVSSLLCAVRWWRLLRVVGCTTTLGAALRLTYVGLFFNLVLPGLTGGDLMRAVLAVREHPDQRADALMSVVVDRLIGLFTLIALASGVIFFVGDSLQELRLPIALVLACVLLGVAAFLSPAARRWTRFDALLARLPQGERLGKLDRAAKVYARHPGEVLAAIGLSLANHLVVTLAVWGVARALGSLLGYLSILCASSVANTLSAVPVAPGGWGVGEAAYGALFKMLGAPASLGVATSVTYRLCFMALGLAGGVFLLLPGGRKVRAEVREARSVAAEGERLEV